VTMGSGRNELVMRFLLHENFKSPEDLNHDHGMKDT